MNRTMDALTLRKKTVRLTFRFLAKISWRSPKTNTIPSLAITPDLCTKLVGSIALQSMINKLVELESEESSSGLNEEDAVNAVLYRGLVLEAAEQMFTPAEA